MANNKEDDRVKLNKTNYSIRASQVIYQYGVGGMVDFKDQTLMTAAPDFWPDKDMLVISDERLAKALHVSHFKMAGGKQDSVISFVRFPEWYFCPRCRRFKPLKQWYNEYRLNAAPKTLENDEYMAKHLRCPACHQDLVVTRIVTVCENGHISDFPWVEWAHAKNFKGMKPVCSNPNLKFLTSGSSSGGMSNIIVECTSCGARASLKDAFKPNEFARITNNSERMFDLRCKGRHPWKHSKEHCDLYPKTLQRGSSSVYYPFTVSSLVIPPYSDEVNARIIETDAYNKFVLVVTELLDEAETDEEKKNIVHKQIDKRISAIMTQAGIPVSDEGKAREFLENKFIETETTPPPESIRYKAMEYLALTGKGVKAGRKGDFIREEMNIGDYKIPFIRQISLIHKVKKVLAQTGFTRIDPAEKSEDGAKSAKIVNIKSFTSDWYPAVQVYGEGIFIEFDQDAINKWCSDNPDVLQRAKILNNNYKNAFNHETDRTITARFVLLHTISHLLIKQLSFECGYNVASLAERIYVSETIGDMAGILIYTADGDSEGTLGGLVRQGRKDVFPATFRKAIESACACSNDPVCSLSTGQGRNSLNLSACYSCTLIPETSCEEFNGLLDRGMVVGTMENPDFGFYSDYVYGNKSWDDPADLYVGTKDITNENDSEANTVKSHIISVEGTDLSGYIYSDIWQMMIDDVSEETDNLFFQAIMKHTEVSDREKPVQYPSFTIKETNSNHSGLLAWKKSKIILFGEEDADDWMAAKDSDYICIRTNDEDGIKQLIQNIIEVK